MIAKQIGKIVKFFREDLWNVKIDSLPKGKAILYRYLRVWVIAISEFGKDKVGEKASALTYFSLLSIVPVAAMAFGIATIFGLQEYLKQELTNFFSGQEEVLEYTLEFSERMLETSSGGIISGIGALFLIYAVGRLLHNIELAFNDIWDTKKGRSLRRKMTDYVSFILLAPLILVLSSATTVFITTSIENIADSMPFLGFMKPVVLFLIQLIPYSLIWFLLFLFYIIFPNTLVKIKAAFIAGVLAGTAYQLTQWAWIEGQVFLNRYSVIYGSFAALPLFLIWLQISWSILLFGAEFAFAIQNVETWSYEDDKLELNQKAKKRFSLLMLRNIIHKFERENEPMSFEHLYSQVNIPRRFVREIIRDLEKSKLIIRVAGDQEEEVYVPGMPISKIDVYTAFNRLEGLGMDNSLRQFENEEFETISNTMTIIDESIKNAPSNRLVKDL